MKVDEKVSKTLEGYIRENIIKKNGIVKNGPIVLEQDDYLPDSIKAEDNKLKNTITELLFKRDRGDNYFYYDGNTLDKEIKSWRERQNIAPTSNNSNDKKNNNNNNGIMEEEERERRNRMEKERENKRKEREEREFRQREKDWEFREFERSKERSKLIEIEKRQQMRAERDLNYDDNDRKKRTREYYRKKREREREREEDLIDIQLEINEQQQEEQYRLLKLQYQQAPIPTVTSNAVTNNNNNNNNNNYYNQQMNNPYKMNSNYNTSPVAGRNMNTTRSPIMTSPTNYYNGNDNIGNTSPLDRSKMGNIAITLGGGNKDKKQTVVIPGFDNEPDNDELYSKKKKKLGALDQHMQEENEKKAKIDKVKNLIETIPTEKDPLFAHPIDWDIIDQVFLILFIFIYLFIIY